MKYQLEINYFLYLLKCAVNNMVPQVPDSTLNWDMIYSFAKSHKVTSTLYFGICKLPEEYKKEITHMDEYVLSYKKNLVLDANRTFELQRIEEKLANKNIDYIFLKGSISKKFYIDSSMRPMNDVDVLFRGADFKTINEIFEDLKYDVAHKSSKDICYVNPINNVLVEMQPHLIDMGYKDWYQYLEGIWDRSTGSDDKPHCYTMSLEDFYIYHIIHMAKHFLNGGIGIKHFLDLYVMKTNDVVPHMDLIDKTLEDLGLLCFKNTIEKLCLYWFDRKNYFADGQDVELITRYILRGGAFGHTKNQESSLIARRGGQEASLLNKIFPSLERMVNYYGEFLGSHKYLLPAYWVRLNISRLLHYDKNSRKKLKVINSISDQDVEQTRKVLDMCGLI